MNMKKMNIKIEILWEEMANYMKIMQNIILLILHITCTILFVICAVNATSTIAEILYIINVALWGVCVGIDICQLFYDI